MIKIIDAIKENNEEILVFGDEKGDRISYKGFHSLSPQTIILYNDFLKFRYNDSELNTENIANSLEEFNGIIDATKEAFLYLMMTDKEKRLPKDYLAMTFDYIIGNLTLEEYNKYLHNYSIRNYELVGSILIIEDEKWKIGVPNPGIILDD